MIPAPRPASDPSLAPLWLPWQVNRPACQPVIGDALLLQYPEVAKALAELARSDRHLQAGVASCATGGGA